MLTYWLQPFKPPPPQWGYAKRSRKIIQKTLTKADLAHFAGSEQWYRHGLVRNVLYTEGAQFVVEYGGAYWLRLFPPPTNAANQPLDKSARNSLICIVKKIQICGLRSQMMGRVGENNGAKREKMSEFV